MLTKEEFIRQGKEHYTKNQDFDMLKSFLCVNCQECCKWLVIQTQYKDIHPQMEFVKFYAFTRDLPIIKAKRGVLIGVPHTCPHLIEGIGCASYDKRPFSCRHYDGRIDPLLKNVCAWQYLDEILREEDEHDEAESEAGTGGSDNP